MINISNDIKTLVNSGKPIAALNLTALWMISTKLIRPSDYIFWVDGVFGVLACLKSGIRSPKKRGIELLTELITHEIVGSFKRVVIFSSESSFPNFMEKSKIPVRAIYFGFYPTLDCLKNANLPKLEDDDLIILGIGSPKQEVIARELRKDCNATIFCLGGSVNIFEGREKACPKWLVRMNLEWFYRLRSQPLYRLNRLLKTSFGIGLLFSISSRLRINKIQLETHE